MRHVTSLRLPPPPPPKSSVKEKLRDGFSRLGRPALSLPLVASLSLSSSSSSSSTPPPTSAMPPVASPVRGRQRRQNDLHQHQFDPFSAPASDPFAPTPAPAFAAPGQVRQSPGSDLGIDHELLLEKRARAPTVKLDEDRLLDPSALPALRERARCLKLKGKGHEVR